MAKYMFLASFTAEGAKGLLAEGGTRRHETLKTTFASLGGTLESFYFAFGSDDVILIGDLPGNAAAAAAALTTSATGAVRTRTVVLLTPEDADAAAKLSPDYRAPGA